MGRAHGLQEEGHGVRDGGGAQPPHHRHVRGAELPLRIYKNSGVFSVAACFGPLGFVQGAS